MQSKLVEVMVCDSFGVIITGELVGIMVCDSDGVMNKGR